ncbi:LysR family transcriptional regulator [Streptomyces sp. NRRL F-5053]|uniref:LysR family transcriptional regulator n=1 Tax=Streptomyces sp. NRRL F-5053 TaxID=1463854 RepID=UPI00099B8DEF|nr:LysR family transcriptional regulator [Streptomyces sp. NRRL F-5053]
MSVPAPADYPPGLLDTTMDQLRTLLAVHEEGTALAAARLLGREQSSIQKQLDTMNRKLGEHCGEPLLRKRGRGERVQFTATGEALVRLARGTLDEWREGLDDARRRGGRTLKVGSTRYTLGYLLDAVEQVNGRYLNDGVELKMAHVRSSSMLERLRHRELDLVCGSILTSASAGAAEGEALHGGAGAPGAHGATGTHGPHAADGPYGTYEGYEVTEWRRSWLSVVTNQDAARLPRDGVSVRALATLPLVVSADGLIPDFLRGWFGSDYRRRMRIAAEIDSAHYGFELLASGVLSGSMLVTEGIGEAVAEGRLAEARGLRALPLVEDMGPPQRALVGAFRRRGPEARDPSHPVSLLWDALARRNARERRSAAERAAADGPRGSLVRCSSRTVPDACPLPSA